jgi:hypothetical protein
MPTNMTALGIVILVLVAIAVLAVAIFFITRGGRSRRLQQRFGPEYDRAVERTGSREQAESELQERVDQREQLDITELEPGARDGYAREWVSVQSRFVDDPPGALRAADQLLTRVMRDRGYPTEGFEQQAAVLSVDDAPAAERYRQAHEMIERNGTADTDRMRDAMLGYRGLIELLLDKPVQPAEELKR